MTKIRPVVGLPTLTWLRAFEAAARTSSFAAAATELNLTSGAISYQIRALEAHLGFALFERRPRGVKLTPMGVAYLPPVRKAFEELADSTVGLFGGTERAQVLVHAPVSFGALWLAPKLAAFSVAHPSIDIRLSSVIWDNAVADEATDLEIRYGTGHWHGYRSERLMNQPIFAVCSPSLLNDREATHDAASLLPRYLIRIIGHENHWLKVRQELQLPDAAEYLGPSVDTTLAALELAAAGAGCALTHRLFLAAYFATRRLVIALPREFADDNSYFVITPERPQRIRREVQLFRDWLVAVAAQERVSENGAGFPNGASPMHHKISRRAMVKRGLIAIPAMSLMGRPSGAAALVPLDPGDPLAKSLGYVADATKVDAAANPTYKPTQKCGNCAQYQGKATDASAACLLFAGKSVPTGGWCKVWALKPPA